MLSGYSRNVLPRMLSTTAVMPKYKKKIKLGARTEKVAVMTNVEEMELVVSCNSLTKFQGKIPSS